MVATGYARTSRSNAILTASPGQLVLMLYDGALKALAFAREGLVRAGAGSGRRPAPGTGGQDPGEISPPPPKPRAAPRRSSSTVAPTVPPWRMAGCGPAWRNLSAGAPRPAIGSLVGSRKS